MNAGKKALIRSFSGNVLIRGAAIVLLFVQSIVVTRVFGAEAFGILSFATSAILITTLITCLGFENLLMREVAQIGPAAAPANARWRIVVRFCLTTSGLVTLGVAGVGAIVIGFGQLFAPYTTALVVVFCLLPLLTLRRFLEFIANGLKNVSMAIIPPQIVFPTLMILGALSVSILPVQQNEDSILIVYGGSVFLSLVFAWFALRSSVLRLRPLPTESMALPTPDGTSIHTPPTQRWIMTSGGYFILASAALILGQNIDVLMAGAIAGPEEAALVRITSRLAEIVATVRMIALMQFRADIAEAWARNDHARLQRYARWLSLIFLGTGIPLFLLASVFAQEILWLYGPDFQDGVWVMIIYMAGILGLMVTGAGSTILFMCGYENIIARISWITLAVNIVGDLIMIPHIGALGCAIANCVSLWLLGILAWWYCRKRVGVDPSVLQFFSKRA